MAKDLKHSIGPLAAEELAACFRGLDDGFSPERFVRLATDGLDALELKARVAHVATALDQCLSGGFLEVAPRLLAVVRKGSARGDQVSSAFHFWPLCDYVQQHGLPHFDAAMDVMQHLTGRFSCEFAVRPYLEQFPDRTWKQIFCWAQHHDKDVRRLASECTRPRLPWAPQVRALVDNPGRAVPLLDTLVGDDELYVRRSVANHLNDMSKHDPDLAVQTCRRWLRADDSSQTAWVVRHGLRGLVKQGHMGALALEGFAPPQCDGVSLTLSSPRVRLNDSLTLGLALRSTAAQALMVDYAVHHKKANGSLSPKVFKWKRVTVGRDEPILLSKDHPIVPISTRRYYPGLHKVEILINGQSMVTSPFELVTPGDNRLD